MRSPQDLHRIRQSADLHVPPLAATICLMPGYEGSHLGSGADDSWRFQVLRKEKLFRLFPVLLLREEFLYQKNLFRSWFLFS